MVRLVTAESVARGHPDKICDQISDAVLDEIIKQDPKARVACETFVTTGLVIVGGEITTTGYVDLPKVVRKLLKEIGYHHRFGFCPETCAIINTITTQSPDIACGVDVGGAGDQGTMIGYACNETPELMPLPISLAHKITKRLRETREKGELNYLGPDGKAQITLEYKNDTPVRISSVILAAQHTEEVLDESKEKLDEEIKRELIEKIIYYTVGEWIDKETKIFVNETGRFILGGPNSDTGMTGRKIIVDTYGNVVPHGGGAFSGKDPTKVDRSASYMARYLAKNIVKTGVARKCKVEISYAIGVKHPTAVEVNTFGTGKVRDDKLREIILKEFDLSPQGIIRDLNLLRPIYLKTAIEGHFGKEEPEFSWEKVDAVEVFQRKLKGGVKCNPI
jgi:S-adenosylmethionine synthetase